MYGFGDDRNPSNDTVNVMEEILIEYITDVVCTLLFHVYASQLTSYFFNSASRPGGWTRSHVYRLMTLDVSFLDQRTPKNLPGWKNYYSCRKISNARVHNSKNLTFITQRSFDWYDFSVTYRKSIRSFLSYASSKFDIFLIITPVVNTTVAVDRLLSRTIGLVRCPSDPLDLLKNLG